MENLSARTQAELQGPCASCILVTKTQMYFPFSEKSMKVHPMFSPVHELARYIHIINAYCREAEYTGDSMLHPLWDVLDHLIEIHTHLAPKSLFAGEIN